MDYLSIGSSPTGEECAQVGSETYREKMRIETAVFVNQLRRVLGEEPQGARLKVKSFPHDFGTYHEVCVVYDENNEEATNYAFKCESETPEFWDEQALAELKEKGFYKI